MTSTTHCVLPRKDFSTLLRRPPGTKKTDEESPGTPPPYDSWGASECQVGRLIGSLRLPTSPDTATQTTRRLEARSPPTNLYVREGSPPSLRQEFSVGLVPPMWRPTKEPRSQSSQRENLTLSSPRILISTSPRDLRRNVEVHEHQTPDF